MSLANDDYFYSYPWSVGTESESVYGAYGTAGQNSRLYDLNPWNRRIILWQSIATSASISNGGFSSSYYTIDKTKLYRFSIWIKRMTDGLSTPVEYTYFGSYSNVAMVGLDGTTTNANAYYWYGTWNDVDFDVWTLYVGHCYPTGTIDTLYHYHPDSGTWKVDGTHINSSPVSGGHDWAFGAAATTVNLRTYQIYGDAGVQQQWCYPRIDLCDGTEPTIQDLLRDGRSYLLGNILVN